MTEEERRRLTQVSINTQPRDVAQLPADNVNRSILSQGVPPFPAGAQATIAKPEVPATTGVATGELRGRDAISGGRMGMDRTPIQTPFGTIYATEQQQKNLAAAQTRQEDRQMALARASEAGFLIGQRLQDESTQRGYAFRQGLAETEAQRALTPAFGGVVTRGAAMRGAQAEVEAERWKQAQAGRSPMSQEPLGVGGIQFRGIGMGQFAPVKNLSFQKGDMTDGGPRSFGGGFPSFDEWMQQKQPSLGDILRGGGVSSKGDFSDFALERSRRAVREKQKQDEWRRNQIDAGLPVVTLPIAQANGLPRYVGY